MGARYKLSMFFVVLVAGLAVASLSVAGHNGDCPPDNPNCNEQGSDGGNALALAAQLQGQLQGQQQGQTQSNLGVNSQTQTGTVTGTQTGTVTGSNTATGSGNTTGVRVEGDTVTYEDARNAVNAASSMFSGMCSRGGSGSAMGGSATAAFTNEMCDLGGALELIEKGLDIFTRFGDKEAVDELLAEARVVIRRGVKLALNRANPVRIHLQWLPVIGQFM